MLRHFSRRAVIGNVGNASRLAGFSTASTPIGRSYGSRLEGKVALITGAARGIGKATSAEFIREGATVVLADIDADLGSQTARSLGPNAHFVPCDVTVESQVSNAVDFAFSLRSHLDIMYNNAGIVAPPSVPWLADCPSVPGIANLDLSHFDSIMRVNVRGALAGIKHAARVMAPAGRGSILCASSVSGILGGLGTHPYAVSKFSVVGIVKSAAAELGRVGVRVNCISPFVIPTPLALEQFGMIYRGAGREELVEIINALGELKGAKCEEVDVAKAAVYLASDEAKYVSGHNLVVDGGFCTSKQLNLRMPGE